MAREEGTEAPTPRRREEVRRRGQVARSAELTTVAAVFAALAMLRISGEGMLAQMAAIMRGTYQDLSPVELTPDEVHTRSLSLLASVLVLLAPLLLAILAAGVLANLLQVGVLWTTEPLKPRLERLDPLAGLRRLLSGRGAVEMSKALAKVCLVGAMAYLALRDRWPELALLVGSDLRVAVDVLASVAFDLVARVAAALLVLAALDYLYQRRSFEASIRMTRRELLEELRQNEGDPYLRHRLRQQQRQLSKHRMLAAVPRATVVVTNPTHLAVALRYDPDRTPAPVVVAKGARLMAEQIKRAARQHDVPVVENPPLAQALYKAVEVGMAIPVALYQAVAEVLAFVYRLKGRREV